MIDADLRSLSKTELSFDVGSLFSAGSSAASIAAAATNYANSEKARKATQNLETQRMAQLATEADAANVAKKKAAGAGQTAGASTRSAFLGGLGFGSGNVTPDIARGNLFGN